MAGGKESPRQKMIGMMYLVLTALLALQVSTAVLEKFIFINATLEELVKEEVTKNTGVIGTIDAAYEKNGKLSKHKTILDAATTLRSTTTGLVAGMEAIKEKMIEKTGGYEEGGGKTKMKGAKDDEIVSSMMLVGGDGAKLEKDLDDYVAHLNKLVKDMELEGVSELHQLTKDAKDIEIYKDDPDHKNKDFLTVTFMKTPTAAGLTSMSQLQSEVLEYEARLLDAMAAKVNAVPVAFNIIVPMVKPRSEIVAAGSSYEADLFITASAEGIDPVMTVNGSEVTVEKDENGIMMGKVKLKTSSPGEKSFEAKIAMNDTVFTRKISYEVIQPTIQVNSATLSALYANCANPLDIQVPQLGTEYNPRFSVSNGKAIPGQGGKVKIVPTSRQKVGITVSSGGNRIGTQSFTVKPIPEPKVSILDRTNRRADNIPSIPASNATRLSIKVNPDANFAQEAPDDRVYVVQKGTYTVPGQAPKPFSGASINIGRANPGVISISLDVVKRRRYDGSYEDVRLDNKFKTVKVK